MLRHLSAAERGLSLIEIMVACSLLSLLILGALASDRWVQQYRGRLLMRRDGDKPRELLTQGNCSRKRVADITFIECHSADGAKLIHLAEE